MKIAHLIFSLRTGGAENMLIDIINEQVTCAEVSLYVINNEVHEHIKNRIDSKVIVKYIDRREGSKNPLPVLLLNYSLMLARYDILHCHNHNLLKLLHPLFYRKTVLTVHDIGLFSPYYKNFNRIFAISEAVKADLFSRQNINAITVNNGVSPSLIAQKENGRGSVFKILQVSRLDHRKKGQHVVLEAIQILKQQGINNIEVYFIGTGDSYNLLNSMVEDLNLGSLVHFLGIRDRAYIYENLKQYDLLVQPSFFEGFGLTIVEAMFAKVPCLVSNIDGPIQIIEDGKYGYHFRVGDSQDLSNKIYAIMHTAEPELRSLANAAYKHASEKFHVAGTAQSYLKNYF